MIPDVVAFPLSLAEEIVAAAGVRVSQIITLLPPRDKQGGGALRVVRQRAVGSDVVELTVCYQQQSVNQQGEN